MTTQTLPQPRSQSRGERIWRQVLGGLFVAVTIAGNVGRAQAKPTARHLREHAYSICGLAFICAAAYTHSVFTGLLVTGIAFFAYEWKVSDDANA